MEFYTGNADGASSTESMLIDTSGRLLVGTTTEGEANADDLTIATSGHTGITIRSGTANRGNVYFSDGTSGDSEYRGYITYDHDGDKLSLGTANATGVLIDSSGRLLVGGTSVYAGAEDANLQVTDDTNAKFVLSNPGNISWSLAAGSDNALAIKDESSSIEYLRIDGYGKVGIGTDNPAGNFEVNGNDGINISNATRTGTNGAQWRLIPHNGSGSATNLRLYEGAGGTEVLNITKDGKVGIGTELPAKFLEVAVGNNVSNGILVKGNSSPLIQIDEGSGVSASFGLDGNGSYFGPTSNHYQVFRTNSIQRMQITSSGAHGLTANSGIDVMYVYTPSSAGTSTAIFRGGYSATAGTTFTGTDSIYIWSNGNIQNTNDSYGQISDEKLKENIVDAGSQWDDFKAVRFRKYNFREETGHETHTQLGVIAQELELTSPGLVYETIDKDEDGNDLGTTTKAVKSSILTKKALVALQEAMAKIETLETKVAALEAA
jgi:hypothetical protein